MGLQKVFLHMIHQWKTTFSQWCWKYWDFKTRCLHCQSRNRKKSNVEPFVKKIAMPLNLKYRSSIKKTNW